VISAAGHTSSRNLLHRKMAIDDDWSLRKTQRSFCTFANELYNQVGVNDFHTNIYTKHQTDATSDTSLKTERYYFSWSMRWIATRTLATRRWPWNAWPELANKKIPLFPEELFLACSSTRSHRNTSDLPENTDQWAKVWRTYKAAVPFIQDYWNSLKWFLLRNEMVRIT